MSSANTRNQSNVSAGKWQQTEERVSDARMAWPLGQIGAKQNT